MRYSRLLFANDIGPIRGSIAEVFNMFKGSAVPPRRTAMLTVFRGATAINDGTTAEPLRSWRCDCGLCRTSTAVAPRLRCDGGRRSAVLTISRDDTAINDGTTAEPRRSWRCYCGTTAIMAVSLRFMPYKHRSSTAPPV